MYRISPFPPCTWQKMHIYRSSFEMILIVKLFPRSIQDVRSNALFLTWDWFFQAIVQLSSLLLKPFPAPHQLFDRVFFSSFVRNSSLICFHGMLRRFRCITNFFCDTVLPCVSLRMSFLKCIGNRCGGSTLMLRLFFCFLVELRLLHLDLLAFLFRSARRFVWADTFTFSYRLQWGSNNSFLWRIFSPYLFNGCIIFILNGFPIRDLFFIFLFWESSLHGKFAVSLHQSSL